MSGWSSRHAEQFANDGFVVVRDLLDPSVVAPLVADLDHEIDKLADRALQRGEIGDVHADLDFSTRLAALHSESEALVWELNRGQHDGPGLFRLMIDPTLLDVIEELVGPEIVAMSGYRLRPKIPGFFHTVLPWHQDSCVFEPASDDCLIITAWIPLIDATPERGCLQFLPGSHRVLLPHMHYRGAPNVEIAPAHLPAIEPVVVPARVGDVVLFTNRTVHSSLPNVSDVVRWSVDIRYQGLTSAPNNLVRSDGSPLNEWSDGRGCFPPEADVLVRSTTHAEEVVRTHAEFRAVRRSHPNQPSTDRWNLGRNIAPFHYENSVETTAQA